MTIEPKSKTSFHLWDNEFWADYGKTQDYSERIKAVQDLIPDDVKFVVDIGCGKGDVSDAVFRLKEDMLVYCVDMNRAAVNFISVPFIVGRLPWIPFKGKTFDLVICLEVLEHISEDEYTASLVELERLSKKYIIVGVPYIENLNADKTKCAGCGEISHIDGHIRSYDQTVLSELFSCFKIVKSGLVGFRNRRKTRLSAWIRRRCGVYSIHEKFLCPKCGFSVPGKTGVIRHMIVGTMVRIIDFFAGFIKKKTPYWFIGLYERKRD